MDDAEKPSLEPLDQCQPNMTQSIIRQRKCLFKRRGLSFPRGNTSETAKRHSRHLKYYFPEPYNQTRHKTSLDYQDSKFVLIKSNAF